MASQLHGLVAMGVKRVEELIAFQRAVLFKQGIYALVQASPQAMRDWKWRNQIFDAAGSVDSNIAEGWGRGRAAQICQFLRYAHASLDEARQRLLDGVARGYYAAASCVSLLEHERVCGAAIRRLRESLESPDKGPPQAPHRPS